MESYNWYYGKNNQGCSDLQSQLSKVYAVEQQTAMEYFRANYEERFGSIGDKSEMVEFAIIFAVAACLSGCIICLCMRNEKKKARLVAPGIIPGIGIDDDEKEGIHLKDTKQSASVTGLVFTASKSIRQSIHNTAKKVVDFTRSNSRTPDQMIPVDNDEEPIVVEGNGYSAMKEEPSALA